MAKYKNRPSQGKKVDISKEDIKDEKQFFKVAIIITLVILVVIYLIYQGMQ